MNNLDGSLGDGLRITNLPCAVKGPWVMVGQDYRRQGWKLHLSCTPDRAEDLLHQIVPLLNDRGTPFKFARSLTVLENINAGQFGHTQVGKFLTIYPSAEDLDGLAKTLVELTRNVYGPSISTDYFLGGAVYARHGAINPVLERDRLGGLRKLVEDAGGLQEDSYEVPPRLRPDLTWPFAFTDRPLANRRRQAGVVDQLAAYGWRPVALMKQKSKGAIVKAMPVDPRSELPQMVIKQARRGHLSDRWGRDAVDRLRQEFKTHQLLEDGRGVLRATRFEAINGDGFLFAPFVEARDLEDHAVSSLKGRPFLSLTPNEQRVQLQIAGQLIDAVSYLHGKGLVHRDLAPANVLIAEDHSVHVIDLEMAARVGSSEPPVGVGTKGFVSPSQAQLATPEFCDDIFSIGALLQLLFIGIDPRRIQAVDPTHRLASLERLSGGDPNCRPLISLICKATDDRPEVRPSLGELRQSIDKLAEVHSLVFRTRGCETAESPEVTASRLAYLGLQGLTVLSQQGDSGWPLSIPLGGDESECEQRDLERLLSVNRGLAGLVYVQAKMASAVCDKVPTRLTPQHELLLNAAQQPDPFEDGKMPGLHFGTAGIAVALCEAGRVSGCHAPAEVLHSLLDRPFDWHDVMHGAAGQGLGALLCGDRFHHIAKAACAHLVAAQSPEGSWQCPTVMPALAGQAHTGFAHGAAGILYFLATYTLLTGDSTLLPTIDRGLGWLLAHATTTPENGLDWHYSSQRAAPMQWWCHGGPGIALTLARIFELTNETCFLHLAESSLRFHERSTRHGNLGQCHGLAGLGEIYLEISHASGDNRWRLKALQLVDSFSALATRVGDDALVWRTENPGLATADFGVGSAGSVHFLSRAASPSADISPPFLLRIDPSRRGDHVLASTAQAVRLASQLTPDASR